MNVRHRPILLAVLLLVPAVAHAQAPPDPTGHWQGFIQAPEQEINIEVDITRNAKGALGGTFTNHARNIKGLPLAKVVQDGTSITFSPRQDTVFAGEFSADGKSITGEFKGTDVSGNDFALPFKVTRTGAANVAAAAKLSKIGKALEGTWNGAIEVEGEKLRLEMTLANQADGTATGTMMNVDRGGIKAPITTATQAGSQVTIEVQAVGATFTGALNAQGTEIAGTFKQGPLSVPLTFRRGAAATK
jgi:hypothetical protein